MDKNHQIMTQWGKLARGFFSYSDEHLKKLAKIIQSIIEKVKIDTNIDCFITYGTLLGAERLGTFIDHDFDVDLAFICPSNNIHVIYSTIIKLKNCIEDQPFCKANFWYQNNGQFGLIFNLDSDIEIKIEFFLAFIKDGLYYQNFAINGELKIEDIYPLKNISLEGRQLKCCNNHEKMLRIIYGPDFLISDENFKYDMAKIQKESFYFLYLGNIKYWDDFYAEEKHYEPSEYAKSIIKFIRPNDKVLEVGGGCGRDLKLLNKQTVNVDVIEGSKIALSKLTIDQNNKFLLNFNNIFEVETYTKNNNKQYDIIYSRFFLHSITELGQINFLQFCSKKIQKNTGLIFLELRVKDGDVEPFFENTIKHYRRIQNLENLIRDIYFAGLTIKDLCVGYNLSIYKTENPYIARLTLIK